MQKIVIDTNVLVSALIQRSYPFLIIDELFFDSKITLCISDELLEEYYDVLNRDKFAKYPDFVTKAEQLLVEIEEKSTIYTPEIKYMSDQARTDKYKKILDIYSPFKQYLILSNI